MYQRRFQCEIALVSASYATGMETARAAKAHIIWTSVALVVLIIASCLTYVFMSKVPTCQRANIVIAPYLFSLTATALEETPGRKISGEHWLLKAYECNQTDGRLILMDEWAENRNENILDDSHTWIIIKEKGVYLIYIQANFKLKSQFNSSSTIPLKLLVDFKYDDNKQHIFAAAHDTQVVNPNQVQDAKLSTFLKMDMSSKSQLSVRAFPSDMLNIVPRPVSTYITLVKWSDNW